MKERYVGMVLSAMTIGEVDKRVVLLSREQGRISAFARGARRPKSALSAVTEPFCFGEFFVYRGRDSYTIEEVRAQHFFPKLRTDLDLLTMGAYCCEVADYFTREGMRAGEELELLYRALTALEAGQIPIRLIRRVYELRMLSIAGYAPIYIEERGCFNDGERDWETGEVATYAIGQILQKPMKEIFSFTVGEQALTELERVADRHMKLNTDRKFRSLEFG